MDQQELKNVLDKHKKWVLGESDGIRADLRSADLSYANLSYADLRSANLRSADLSYANLSYADLSYANLSYANLRSANLSYANLSYADLKEIRDDYFKVLIVAKDEVIDLYKSIVDGKINGSQYEGECACLVGTIANTRKEHFENLQINLRPEADRLSEKWFLGIEQGDTPQNNPICEITKIWTEQFMKEHSINIPTRIISWS